MFANVHVADALKLIERRDFTGFQGEDIYNLYLTAYGDKGKAERARTHFIHSQLEAEDEFGR